MSEMKIRATLSGNETNVKCLMSHPMENGQRKDSKTGNLIPAHFIQEVICKTKGRVVLTASLNGGVSKNPYLWFKFKGGAVGDPIEIAWKDNRGKTERATTLIT